MNFFSTLLLLSLIMTTGTVRAEVEPRIAAGGYHSVALKADGTVWTWGLNDKGQLGTGSTTSALLPEKISFQNYTATAVSAGESHTLMLLNDGTVRAWGSNEYGQLGNSSTTDSNLPVVVKDNTGLNDLTGIVAIAAGATHSLAVKKVPNVTEGFTYSVWSWGNSYAANGNLPVEVTGLTGTITSVSAGRHHSVALKSDGTVWAWGLNLSGQLGDGSFNPGSTPVQAAISEVTAIAAGGNHTVALKTDGSAWTWGNNAEGQLGVPTSRSPSLVPVRVVYLNGFSLEPLTDIIAIAAGETHSAAITSDFKIWMFGYDGLISHPPTSSINFGYAEHFNTIPNASQIVAGMNHTMVLDSAGLITSWGSNTAGQLGRGFTSVATYNSSYPVLGFNVTGVCRAMIGESCYQAVADAYTSVADSATILVMIATLYEPLEFSRGVDVTLSGSTGSEIRGPLLTISTGSLVIGSNMTVTVT